jgi:hypothetical protein
VPLDLLDWLKLDLPEDAEPPPFPPAFAKLVTLSPTTTAVSCIRKRRIGISLLQRRMKVDLSGEAVFTRAGRSLVPSPACSRRTSSVTAVTQIFLLRATTTIVRWPQIFVAAGFSLRLPGCRWRAGAG